MDAMGQQLMESANRLEDLAQRQEDILNETQEIDQEAVQRSTRPNKRLSSRPGVPSKRNCNRCRSNWRSGPNAGAGSLTATACSRRWRDRHCVRCSTS